MSQNPKAKKGKANGFLMFLLEYRRQNGKEADMMTSQKEAGDLWEKMLPEERQKYFSQSKSGPAQGPARVEQRYNSFGVSFDEIDRQKNEEKQQQMTMELTIETMLTMAKENNTLDLTTFHFLSTSSFVETLSGDIFPAELAMSKFSLADGVYDCFHMLINPGELPLGMAAEALDHSEKTHKLDLPPKIDGETSYNVIFNTILQFLEITDYGIKKKKIPPIFVESGQKSEEYNRAKLTIEKIVTEAGEQDNLFQVFPIESLLLRLNKKCVQRRNDETGSDDKPFSSIIIAKDMLARDKFAYANIGCDFHHEKDCHANCCLSKVKRFGYSIATYCMTSDDKNLMAGFHYPVQGATEVADEAQIVEDKEWESELTESFKNIRIESRTTMSQRSELSYPYTRSVVSLQSNSSIANRLKSDSHSSVNQTDGSTTSTQAKVVPTVSASSALGSVVSFSDMIRGRGGKRIVTRGGLGRGSKPV